MVTSEVDTAEKPPILTIDYSHEVSSVEEISVIRSPGKVSAPPQLKNEPAKDANVAKLETKSNWMQQKGGLFAPSNFQPSIHKSSLPIDSPVFEQEGSGCE